MIELLKKTIVVDKFAINAAYIQSISEFRNLYGTGHGREVQNYEIDKIYAALIANLSTTIVFFIIQSHKKYFKR